MQNPKAYQGLLTARAKRLGAIANLVLVAVAVFFLLLCIHLLLVYNFNSPPSVPRYYYLIATLGVILPSLALKLPEKVKVRLALVLTSTVFVLYLSELALFLLTPTSNELAARSAGIPFDARTKYEVVEDLRARGVDAYPSVSTIPASDAALFPLSGVSEKTTVQCNESGNYVLYESDQYGFNNPGESWIQQPDVVLIGDSFTHGFCVPAAQSLAGQLRSSGLRVLNLGIFGSGPLTEFAVFKEYAGLLKPPIVLWVYFEGNDFDELAEEETSQWLMRYYLDDGFSQDLVHRQSESDRLVTDFIDGRMGDERLHQGKVTGFIGFYNYIAASEMGRGITLARLRTALGPLFHRDRPNFSLFQGILRKSRDASSSWGGQLYFVYLPEYDRYASKVDSDAYRHRGEVLSIVKALNIPVINVDAAFAAHPDPLSLFPFRLNNHFGPEGYRLAVQTIESSIKRDR